MEIGIGHYLTVAAILFTIGIFGIFLNRKNVIVILMSIELMLLAVNLNLVAFSSFNQDLVGQVFAMMVLIAKKEKLLWPSLEEICRWQLLRLLLERAGTSHFMAACINNK